MSGVGRRRQCSGVKRHRYAEVDVDAFQQSNWGIKTAKDVI
jgi:hypothetical protein